MTTQRTISTVLAISMVWMLFASSVMSSPLAYDYDNVRGLSQLLELIASQDSLPVPQRYYHQMERKGGRQPSLRLRFGKRSETVGSDPEGRVEADKLA